MPIRSITDLRRQAGADWQDSSDEDLISAYAENVGLDPVEVATKLGYDPGSGGKNAKRLSASVDRYQAGLYGLGEELAGAAGLEGVRNTLAGRRRANELQADVASSRARMMGAIDSYKDVGGVGDAADYVVGLGIQSLPYLGEAAAGGIGARAAMSGTRAALRGAVEAGDEVAAKVARSSLNRGSLLGGATASYPSATGDVLQSQREQSGEADLGSAAALGVPYAALNMVGLEGAAARAGLFRNTTRSLDELGGVRGGLARAGATGLRVGVTESLAETGQEGINQLGRMVVDPNEAFLSDAAKGRFAESAVGGFALGKVSGAALGGWRRSEGSILGGSNQNAPANARGPEEDAIAGAINSPGSNPDLELLAPINPYDVGGYVTALRQNQETTLDSQQQSLFGGTAPSSQVSGLPPSAPAQAAQVPASAPQQAAQPTQSGQQAPQVDPQIAATAELYGLRSVDNMPTPTWEIGGQRLYGRPTVDRFMAGLVEATKGRSEMTRLLDGAFLAANLVKFTGTEAKKLINTLDKAIQKYQLDSVDTVQNAAVIINDQIRSLAEAGKGETDTNVTNLAQLYEALIGQEAPAYALTQQVQPKKGTANETRQQQQSNAGVRAVSEPGGAGQSPDGGDVRPANVQPVAAGSVDEGSLGLQVGQPRESGVRAGASDTGGAVDGVGRSEGQAQEVTEEGAPDEKEAFGRKLMREVFGERDGDVVYDLFEEESTQAEIAQKYGIGRSRIAQIKSQYFVKGTLDLKEEWQNRLLRQLQTEGVSLSDAAKFMGVQVKEDTGPGEVIDDRVESVETAEDSTRGLSEETTADKRDTNLRFATEKNTSVLSDVGEKNQANSNFKKAIAKQGGKKPNEKEAEALKELTEADLQNLALEADAALMAKIVSEIKRRTQVRAAKRAAGKEEEVDEEADNEVQELRGLEEDAVQEPEGEELAGDDGAEPEAEEAPAKKAEKPARKAKAQKAAPVEKPAVDEDAGKTLEERAAIAWDKVAANFPSAPKFASLTEEQQETFIEFGPENWTEADVQNELIKLAKQMPASNAMRRRAEQQVQEVTDDSQPLLIEDASLDEMAQTYDGVKDLRSRYDKLGIGNAFNAVSQFFVSYNPNVDWEGIITSIDNQVSVVLRQDIAANRPYAMWTMSHELGHAVDQTVQGEDRFSSDPRLNLRVVDGKVTAFGNVAREMADLHRKDVGGIKAVLDYPFDRSENKGLSNNEVRQELFAQIWALYTTSDGGRALIERNAPATADFMREVIDRVQKTDDFQTQGLTEEATFDSRKERVAQSRGQLSGQANEGQQGQVAQTETPAFKRWFGDSKVVDSKGQPMVVYHGTQADVDAFTTDVEMTNRGGNPDGFYFTPDQAEASKYAQRPWKGEFQAGANVMPVYLSLTNPFNVSNENFRKTPVTRKMVEQFEKELRIDNPNLKDDWIQSKVELFKERGADGRFPFPNISFPTAAMTRVLKAGGYDGMIDGEHFVVFEPGQIKSAIGNQGTFDPANPKINRSRTARALSNIDKLPPQVRGTTRSVYEALADWTTKGLDRVVFTADLITRAANEGLGAARKFQRLLQERGSMARSMEKEVERIADLYANVPEAERGVGPSSVNQFLFDSTREKKWGFNPRWRKTDVTVDEEMEQRYDALSPESKAFVNAVLKHGDEILALKKKTVMDFTNTEYDTQIDQAKADGDDKLVAELQREKKNDLKKFERLFQLREGMPYAPIKRFGNYAVVAKSPEYREAEEAGDTKKIRELESDPDHYHVSFVENKSEARRLAEQLRDQGFFGTDSDAVDFFERDKFRDSLFGGDTMLSALTKLRASVDARAGEGDKVDRQLTARMQKVVSDLYLEALAEGSARKSELRRRGVSGEVDMLRSFTSQGQADANFLSAIQYNSQVQESLQEMRLQAKRGGNRARKSELMNELMARYTQSLDYEPAPFAQKITRITSIWFLASSPGYYLQNLTQPFMMSLPVMAGRHDYAPSANALLKAYTDLKDVMKSAKLFSQGFDFSKVPADVQDVIEQLVNRGRIDIGLDTELGEFKIEGEGALTDRWNKVDKGLRLAVQKVESVNRLSTAIAAYRLELDKTGNKELALDYADQILTDTHGDYTTFNAPRAFNTNLGKVALQFRKFQLIQLSLTAKLIRDAFSGKDRAVAFKTLSYLWGTTAVMAGVVGLPGFAAISWALGSLLGDDDEPFNIEGELRRYIGDETIANMILRGAPTVTGADLSGKIGMGNMLSVMPFTEIDKLNSQKTYEIVGTLLGGPAGGLAARVADGMAYMSNGDYWKGLEMMTPKGVGDAMKAVRIGGEGVTNRRGDTLLPADEVSAVEAAIQAIGLSPTKTSVRSQKQGQVIEMDNRLKERTTRIKNDYVKASRANDAAGMREAREAWSRLQDTRVKNGYNRRPLSDLLKAPQEQRKRERNTAGGVQFNSSNRRFVEELSE